MTAIVEAGARALTRIAAIFLLAMVAVNVLDVGLRGLFKVPFQGGYDLVSLCLAAVAFLAIPETFLRNEHITIELIDSVVPRHVVAALKAFGLAATVVFAALLTYYMIQPAIDFVRYNEVTLELQMPVFWKAVPVLAAFAFSVLTVLYMFACEIVGRSSDKNGR